MAGKSMALSPAQAMATVTVMNQHGEVIHNGTKSFFSAFKEAKEAYKQRKAEIAVERRSTVRARETVMRRNSSRYGGTITDSPSQSAIEDGSSHHSKKKHRKPTRRNSSSLSNRSGEEEITEDALIVRGVGGEDTSTPRRDSMQQQQRFEEEQERQMYQQQHHHDGALTAHDHARDMAPALFNDPSVVAVQTLLARVQSIIDEINCITVGLTTLLTELQKTPETFAAVGLSLAEIANMLTHIAPGALVVLKTGFPTVFALLSSPHFAIIAGVAGAATVIVLGGYKIVKNIMAGADVNMALAYGDLPDEAILEETALGGEILGEVVEEDRRIEAAPSRRQYEPIEELPPAAVPRQEKRHEQRSIMPAEDPISTSEREESKWLKRSNSSFKKSEDKKERVKVERRHTSAISSSSSPSKKDKEKRHHKEEKEGRSSSGKDKDRDPRDRKLERRATSARQDSSSSGVSSNRSESSERPAPVKTSKSFSAAILGKDKEKSEKDGKEKKKNALMKLFDGKSK